MAYGAAAFTDVRYGPHPHMLLDVYTSSVGTASSGNIAIVHLPGGGWNGNDKRNPGSGMVPGPNHIYDFFNYIGDKGSLSALSNPPINWIAVSYPSGGFAGLQKASSSEYFPGPVQATQLVIQHVKDNATTYGVNPSYVYGFGDSAGANNLLLAQFLDSRQRIGTGQSSADKYARVLSSRPSGVIAVRALIDFRTVGVNPTIDWQIGPQKLFGVTNNTELAAINPSVLRAASPLYHIQAARAENANNKVYAVYEDTGAHTIPYTNPHDSSQLTTLNAALAAAGLTGYGSQLISPGAWDPGAGTADAISLQVWDWLRARISAIRAGTEVAQ